jgi:hypothetical protein
MCQRYPSSRQKSSTREVIDGGTKDTCRMKWERLEKGVKEKRNLKNCSNFFSLWIPFFFTLSEKIIIGNTK